MARVMAIDYGDQRIGLAVSDLLGVLAGEAWTMNEWNRERAALRIAEEARKREVGTLVLGLPKNMDGTEGPRAALSREFKKLLGRAAQQHRGPRHPARGRQEGARAPQERGRRGRKPHPGGLSRQPALRKRAEKSCKKVFTSLSNSCMIKIFQ